MAGRQHVGAELLGGVEQVVELDLLVAGDARDRRLAGGVAVGEAVDDGRGKAALVVEHVVRNAERVGNPAGVVDVLAGAAAALAAGGVAVIVELQGDADDVVPGLRISAATTEESTPPDMATTTRWRLPANGRARSAIGVLGGKFSTTRWGTSDFSCPGSAARNRASGPGIVAAPQLPRT